MVIILSYIFSIIMLLIGIGYLIVYSSRTNKTYSFIICQFLLMVWILSQFLVISAVNTSQLFLSYCVGNLAICFIGTAWLTFSLLFSQKKVSTWLYVFIVIISIFHLVAVVTNPTHHLYYTSFSFDNITRGILFYTNTVYTYACTIIGVILVCRECSESRVYSKPQAILLFLAIVIPLIINIAYISGIISSPLDITPLSFTVSILLMLVATHNFGFLSVNDIAIDKVFNNLAEGIIICNRHEQITYINNSARDYLHNELSSLNIQTIENQQDVHSGDKVFNIRRYSSSHKAKTVFYYVITDITEYHKLLASTSELANANQTLAIEKERNRIAQEVHDTTGHTLTMINALIKLLKIELKDSTADIIQYLDEGEKLSSNGISELRQSINNMRSDKDYSLLTHRIEELKQNIIGIACELTIVGTDGKKYMKNANVMYECCREAITNCMRYSQATKLEIILRFNDFNCEMHIYDNGVGTDNIVPNNGLRGIIERVEKSGGSVNFNSSLGEGFGIIIKLPVEEDLDD